MDKDNDIKINIRNKSVISAMEQLFEKVTLNDSFIEDIKRIRSKWLIPKKGFKTISKDFKEWIINNKANNFKDLSIKNTKIIKTNPSIFLNKVYNCLTDPETNDNYPTDLYYLENERTFYHLINEKPFPGIVHYILFNNLFIPETKEAQLTRDRYGNMVIRCGPNATKKDVEELLSVMNFFQKNMNNYKKGRDRASKLYSKDKEVYQDKLDGYDALDVFNLDDNKKVKNKSLSTLRQRKKRFKDKISNIC